MKLNRRVRNLLRADKAYESIYHRQMLMRKVVNSIHGNSTNGFTKVYLPSGDDRSNVGCYKRRPKKISG